MILNAHTFFAAESQAIDFKAVKNPNLSIKCCSYKKVQTWNKNNHEKIILNPLKSCPKKLRKNGLLYKCLSPKFYGCAF